MLTLKAALAVLIVALVIVLQIGNTVEASQPPENKPRAFVNPGTSWACGRLKSVDHKKVCKRERRKYRLVRCQYVTNYRLWYCLTTKYCKQHASDYGDKKFCKYNLGDNSGAGGADTLPCIGSSSKRGNCVFSISSENGETTTWDDRSGVTMDDEDFREFYDDSVEDVCEDCTVEECKLRCHANFDCKGINYNVKNKTCTMIYSGVTGASEVDIDGNRLTASSQCYARDQDCTNLPRSCTKQVQNSEGESGACWGAGEGYRPCSDDDYCSLDECMFLCKLNPKCQGYQVATDYDSTTCLHFSLLPTTVDTLVDAQCYSVARAHQFSSSCNTDDALPKAFES
mmetsp:Transcript_20171/g.35258  ORF Transcript_20171/g.35258 Transcript_20171/m.35258 type:complete len:341 (-) Transcript_20171:266-1288(-)|eukprot:CAMPEP_0171487184 /NCGR_PEP_ID=MMETSP0958-20121227/1503_1 /TAXON_ID=87120 /ORGANISM="Aurantiochytrium limacinum, Strain ATCCMYA-1381" /LENGTH=340 /DNA_ID=CAMNT_0012020143 /DNA_START=242 /DNA_END=1264 /DNA_ORIENTATION=+